MDISFYGKSNSNTSEKSIDIQKLILRTKKRTGLKRRCCVVCNPVEGQTEAELMQILVTTVQSMPGP